jgi:hypothetical protein
MHWMNELVTSGRVFDVIAVLMAIEAAALLLYARSGDAARSRAMLLSVGAGFFLVIAFRAFVSGAPAAWTGAFLTCALVVHVIDLESRLRR